MGCSTGRMAVREVHYHAVTNGEQTNFYRLRVEGKTRLGQAEYRSGYFPTDALDRLFGNVNASKAGEALGARQDIEKLVRDAVKQTTEAWLKEARDPDASTERLRALQMARRRVLAYPVGPGAPFPGAVEIEYNPAQGVFIRHADEKLVFLLSSNPDEVVQDIVEVAEHDKTALAVNRLGSVVAQRARNEVAAAEAAQSVTEDSAAIVAREIEAVLAATAGDGIALGDLELHIDTLLTMLELAR